MKDIAVGDVYGYAKANGETFDNFKIVQLTLDNKIICSYLADGFSFTTKFDVFIHRISTGQYKYVIKPLDQAFTKLDLTMCIHKNIRKDIFFTSKVFLTCNDCGKALN